MTSEQRATLDRVRPLVAGRAVREVKMFGAVAIMIDERMVAAANKDGSLLVRVADSEDARLIGEGDATRAEMGTGRDMGTGWIRADVATPAGQDRIPFWIEAALRRKQRGGVEG
jgi:TfoX/Sxy family transcriptional regulator of competence genes